MIRPQKPQSFLPAVIQSLLALAATLLVLPKLILLVLPVCGLYVILCVLRYAWQKRAFSRGV